MQISKKTLATILIGLASVIGIVSIFCFFGDAIKATEGEISVGMGSMFNWMFGGEIAVFGQPVKIELKAGMTVLFVIEVIILLLAVVVVAGNISKKLKENTTICLTSIIALLTLVAVIMSFCTKKILDVPSEYSDIYKLGAGALSYSILGIIGIISGIAGVIVYKKA